MFSLRHSAFAAIALALFSSHADAQPRPDSQYRPPQNQQPGFSSPNSRHSGSYRRPVIKHESRYEFGHRSHVRQLAEELYNQANVICWEMHDFYDKNPGYNHVYRDMYEIKEGAKKINEMVKRSSQNSQRRYNSDPMIVRELQQLDRRFQEFQADVENWRPNSRRTSRSTLVNLISECEDTLFHLMDDYGVRYNQRQHDTHRNHNHGGGHGGQSGPPRR